MANFLKDKRRKLAKIREKSARKSKNIKDYQKKITYNKITALIKNTLLVLCLNTIPSV